MIEIAQTGHGDPLVFEVTVAGEQRRQRHDVSLSRADHRRLTGGTSDAEELVRAAFRFLLDREPPEAIMASFDVNIISSYFPEFENELPRYLSKAGGDGGR